MTEQIPEAVKATRATQAKACAAELSQAYRAQFIGRTLEVLFEHPIGQGVWSGHSAYCFPVQASHTAISKNILLPVSITGLSANGLCGNIVL